MTDRKPFRPLPVIILDLREQRIDPRWSDNVPWCDERCAQHDGKRCQVTGLRPDGICEPAVKEMAEVLT